MVRLNENVNNSEPGAVLQRTPIDRLAREAFKVCQRSVSGSGFVSVTSVYLDPQIIGGPNFHRLVTRIGTRKNPSKPKSFVDASNATEAKRNQYRVHSHRRVGFPDTGHVSPETLVYSVVQ